MRAPFAEWAVRTIEVQPSGMDTVSGAARNQNGILQIPRASLGEPTIPSGL